MATMSAQRCNQCGGAHLGTKPFDKCPPGSPDRLLLSKEVYDELMRIDLRIWFIGPVYIHWGKVADWLRGSKPMA